MAKGKGKAPAFQFYVRDWLSDPQLRQCCFAVRGMWIDFLCYMWEAPERGKLEGTVASLARLIGADLEEMHLFLFESMKYEFASVTCNGDVTNCNCEVTLINRRMHRDYQELVKTRKRVAEHRAKKAAKVECNGEITPSSSSSSSSSCTKVHSSCSEQSSSPASGFTSFPLQDETQYIITTNEVSGWAASFPALGKEGVEQCLREAREWCISNPAKRKTRKGARSFLTKWLTRANKEALEKRSSKAGQPDGGGFWGNEL